MISHKLTSGNPLMAPNKMTQRLVEWGDYNKLWDDVFALYGNPVSAGGSFPITANTNTPAILTVNVINGVSTNLEDNGLGYGASIVTAGSLIGSVNYTGTGTLTYNIREVGGQFAGPADEDPSVPFILFDYYDAGAVKLIEVYVYDGTISTMSVTYVEVQNNNNFTVPYPLPIDLGTAANYAILAEAGITTTGVTSITGDIGVSPITAAAITGFGLVLDGSGTFSTSSLVTGRVYAADYTAPTPAIMGVAIGDVQAAFTAAYSLADPTPTINLAAGVLNGHTLTKGIYNWNGNVGITTGITLDGGGDPNASFVLQVAGILTVNNGATISLINGTQPKNVTWAVAGAGAVIGTGVDISGDIISQTLISVATGSTINGRLLAGTAVTLDATTLIKPV